MKEQQTSKPVGLEATLDYEESTSSVSKDCNFWQTVLVLCNVINHVLVLLTTGYLAYLSRDLSNTTNLHVLLCTIGVSKGPNSSLRDIARAQQIFERTKLSEESAQRNSINRVNQVRDLSWCLSGFV